MLIFGHKYFKTEPLYKINSWEDAQKTPSNSLLLFTFQMENYFDLIQKCNKNSVKYTLKVETLKEVIFAHNFGANYIVVEKSLAKNAQKVANEYLFDAKILAIIEHEDEIEELALFGIDGVIFSNTIKET